MLRSTLLVSVFSMIVASTLLAGCGDFTGIGNSPHTSQSSWGNPEDSWSTDQLGPGPASEWTASPIDNACQVRSRTYTIGEMTSARYRVRGAFDGVNAPRSATALRFTLLDHGTEVGSFAVVRDAKTACSLDVRADEPREATTTYFDVRLANVFTSLVAFDAIRVDASEGTDAPVDMNPMDDLDFVRAL
jgi:hypothetical protein